MLVALGDQLGSEFRGCRHRREWDSQTLPFFFGQSGISMLLRLEKVTATV